MYWSKINSSRKLITGLILSRRYRMWLLLLKVKLLSKGKWMMLVERHSPKTLGSSQSTLILMITNLTMYQIIYKASSQGLMLPPSRLKLTTKMPTYLTQSSWTRKRFIKVFWHFLSKFCRSTSMLNSHLMWHLIQIKWFWVSKFRNP